MSRPGLPSLFFILFAVAIAAVIFMVLRPAADRLQRLPPAPSDTTAGRPLEPTLVARLEPLLGNWLNRWQKAAPGLSLGRLRSGWKYELAPRQPEDGAAPDADTANLRRREALGLISYSPDRTRCVDCNTYAVVVISAGDTSVESEPDQLVELIDLRSNARTRLAFHGTASSTDEVFWLDDSTIVLCGSGEKQRGDRLSAQPELCLVRLNRLTVTTYSLP